MNYSTYRFTLDLHRHQSNMSVAVFQYDSAVRLIISLTDGGKPYLIENGSEAIFYGKRSDGVPLCLPCILQNESEIVFDFNDTVTAVLGMVNCQIRLYGKTKETTEGGEVRELVTAPRFTILVEHRVVESDDIEIVDSELEALDQIFLDEVERQNAEKERLANEEERKANELQRIANEEARQEQMKGLDELLSDKFVSTTTEERQTIKSDLELPSVIAGEAIIGTVSAIDINAMNRIYSEDSIEADGQIKGGTAKVNGLAEVGSLKSSGAAEVGSLKSNGAVSGKYASFSSMYVSGYTQLEGDVYIGDSNLDSTLNVSGSAYMGDLETGYLKANGSASVDGSLSVAGDLLISGKTISIDHENMTVRDNVIIVNAQGDASFSNSGIVINTGEYLGDSQYSAYGILYQPDGDAVYIGKGVLEYNEDGYDMSATFTFTDGEAIPLAARSGDFTEGVLPIWDASKNAFVSSGVGIDDIGGGITEYDFEITDPSQFTTENLATMSGNILVKCDIEATDDDMSVTIPIGVKLINFNGHRTNYSIVGHQDCRLISAVIGMGVNSYEVFMSNFGSIEFCTGYGCFRNCSRIAHSSIWNAYSCSFITDVVTSCPESQIANFYECSNITNVKVADVSDESSMGVEFEDCSNISNVTAHGSADGIISYINCKYVDALTCVGYGVGVPCVDASGIVSFLTSAEGGSYGS